MSNWDWELRLFCSADIVGSTAYKAQKSLTSKTEWPATFSEFFHAFPNYVQTSYESLPKKYPKCSEQLSPWKFSGDEVLFSVPVHHHTDGISHIWAFKHAVEGYPNDNWKQKTVPLGLKATAWIAGFPVRNRKVKIPNTDAMDFIGPSIDLGFRLSKFATPSKFILSCALALLLLDGQETRETSLDDLHLHFDGKELLKGVIDGAPYPIVYCSMKDNVVALEEELLGTERKPKHDRLKVYLRNFLDETPKLMRPFIASDDNSKYNSIPAEIENLRRDMQSEEEDRGYLVGGEEEKPGTTGATKEPEKPNLPKPDDT